MRTHMVTRASGLKKLARNVGLRRHKPIARAVVGMKVLRKHVIRALSGEIQKELTTMVSKKNGSILRDMSRDGYAKFSWDSLITELEKHAPVLLQFLTGCVHVQRRVRKKVKKNCSPKKNSIVGLCAAILLRNRNTHMNLFQRIISVILDAGHASKRVSKKYMA